MVTENQLSFHDSDPNDASLSALSFLIREKKRKDFDASGRRGGGVDGGRDSSGSGGIEADADALEEEIEQMRVNKRVEARLMLGMCHFCSSVFQWTSFVLNG